MTFRLSPLNQNVGFIWKLDDMSVGEMSDRLNVVAPLNIQTNKRSSEPKCEIEIMVDRHNINNLKP